MIQIKIVKKPEISISITFGECVETHAGMQQIGQIRDQGFSVLELEEIAAKIPGTEIVYLHHVLPLDQQVGNEAAILIIRNGLSLFNVDQSSLWQEMMSLDHDKKAFMKGRVVNKLARHNSCMADCDQEPDYEKKQGRIYNFNRLPILNHIQDNLPLLCGLKGQKLNAELNVYYDLSKCGIGFHGDTERRIVVCFRLGFSNPMDFQWFYQTKPVYQRIQLMLNSSDLYIMSDKAVGFDWKRRSILTLRHAAGAKKYRTTKHD